MLLANISQTSVQVSKLHCHVCLLDPTAKEDDKAKQYTLSKLDSHLKTGVHGKKKRYERAFLAAGNTPVACPFCEQEEDREEPVPRFSAFKRFWDHVFEEHIDSL